MVLHNTDHILSIRTGITSYGPLLHILDHCITELTRNLSIGLAMTGLLSALADRLPRKYVFIVSLSISACFLLTIPFFTSLFWLAGMVLLWSIASEAQRPLASMITMDLVLQDQRRQAISLLRLAMNIGSMVSASIGGLIASLAFLPLFGVDAGTTLLFALLMLLLFPRPRPSLQAVQTLAPTAHNA